MIEKALEIVIKLRSENFYLKGNLEELEKILRAELKDDPDDTPNTWKDLIMYLLLSGPDLDEPAEFIHYCEHDDRPLGISEISNGKIRLS